MVTERERAGYFLVSGLQRVKELLWTRDPAKSNQPALGCDVYLPPREPEALRMERRERRRARQHNRVRAFQSRERFAQPSHGKQSSPLVLRGQQNDIKIAMQAAMLKSVIQQMKLAGPLLFSQPTGLVSIGANNHRCLQLSRDQQWLIAKLLRRSVGINHCNFNRPTAVAAGKHVEINPSLLQQLAQRDDKRCLSTASHRDVSNADNGTGKPVDLKNAAIIKRISASDGGAEDK